MGFKDIIKKAKDAALQNRTGNRAIYNGREIQGCGECGNNKTFPGVLPFAPIHKCIVTSTSDEDLMTIWDPFNVPDECPLKIEGIKV